MSEVGSQASGFTADMAFVFVVLGVVFAGFLSARRSPDVIAMIGAAALLVGGVLPVEELLAVFSNPGPVTVGALFVVSGALQRTGVVDRLGVGAERLGQLGPLRARLLMLAVVMAVSGVINNTPVVMVLTPLVITLADRLHTVPSKLLIPLSYASILGGACTIIGTSTNLIVDGVARAHGLEPFGIFEITAPGLIIGAVGIVYLALAGPWLLPERRPTFSTEDVRARRDFVTELFVSDDSDLAGRELTETDLFGRDDVVVVEVLRGGSPLRPQADLVLEPGDRLTIQSNATNVLELRDMVESTSRDEQNAEARGALLGGFWPLTHRPTQVMEGIVGPGSRLVGERVGALNLRLAYGIRVLALHRQGAILSEFDAERLRFGDIMLLESREERLRELFAQRDLINLNEPAARMYRRGHAPLALAAVAAIVVLAALGVMPIAGLAILGAVALVGLRCIEPREAYQAIDWRILFLIFGMLAIGRALQLTGAAAFLVDNVAGVASAFGPWVVLAGIYVVGSLLTEMITNNAVAVVLTPLAIGLAQQMDVDPRAFVVAVMFAASASFATPLGYQTNTIVYGAGNYRFRDFLRIGLPLNVIVGIVAVLLIPRFWPF